MSVSLTGEGLAHGETGRYVSRVDQHIFLVMYLLILARVFPLKKRGVITAVLRTNGYMNWL